MYTHTYPVKNRQHYYAAHPNHISKVLRERKKKRIQMKEARKLTYAYIYSYELDVRMYVYCE